MAYTQIIMACDLIKLFPRLKEQDNVTRLGERKKGRQNKERISKWKMKSEKMVTTNDNKPHFSDILITQSLNKHLFFKHLFALISM